MSDRGMKKWNAYKSLPEHDPAIRREMHERFKVPRPSISEEEAEIINEILTNYHGENVHITYYRHEELYELDTVIKKIEPYSRYLLTTDNHKISLHELVGLKRNK